LLIVLAALSVFLNIFPQIQTNSAIIAVGILAAAIEIYGFIRDRTPKDESGTIGGEKSASIGQASVQQSILGPQTNIAGDVHGPVLSGKFHGPVATGGEAVDMSGSTGAVYKPNGPVKQYFGDIITIRQHEKPPVPNQIPAPPKDFIGRKEEIDSLLAGFKSGATITGLRGLGGIGKTTLAMVLADRLKSQFPDGQIFINLLGTNKKPMDPADAMAHVIRAYQGADASLPDNSGELAGLYQSVLSGKKTLILLDNAASREQVDPLLPPFGCGVIVTSRNKFALPGLKEKDLDVLPLDNSKKLLLDISERIGSQAEDLAKLCGCLPIALRNAAYALAERRDLSVAEYLQRLHASRNRVELVAASFSLSYDLLSSELQRLWCLLSVFPADFDRSGASTVWGLDLDSAAKSLGNLLKWSLVEFNPASERYSLHDLARDFAASCLPSKEMAMAEQRHAEHYRNVLSASKEIYKQGGENVLAGLGLFDRERANIQVGQAWAENNLEGSSAIASLCSSYPDAGAYVLDLRLHPQEKIRWLEAAVAAARKIKDKGAEGVHLGNLGGAYYLLGDSRQATEYYEQALAIARELDDRRGEGDILGNLGLAYHHLGETRRAVEYYEQAQAIAREIDDRRGEGYALGNLGLAYLALGESRKAIEYYEQALAIAYEIGDRRCKGRRLGNLGLAYYSLGESHKAIEYYEQALAIAREIGDRRGEGYALGNLGLAYYSLCESRKAIEYYERHLAIAREIGDRRGEGKRLGNLGLAYHNLGETRRAVNYYEQALAIAHEIGDRKGEGYALGNLGLAYYGLGESRKAIEYYEQALAIAREIGDRRGEGNYLFNMSLALACLGKRKQAIEYGKETLKIREEIEDPRAEQVRRQLAEWQG